MNDIVVVCQRVYRLLISSVPMDCASVFDGSAMVMMTAVTSQMKMSMDLVVRCSFNAVSPVSTELGLEQI